MLELLLKDRKIVFLLLLICIFLKKLEMSPVKNREQFSIRQTQAHQRSGQNTDRSFQNGESRTFNNTSNPNFQTATKFDPKTQSNVNMTRGEFYSEKREQGANIGNNIALEMMEKAEQEQQRRKNQ